MITLSSASKALSAISLSASMSGRSASAPTRSRASPPVRSKPIGLPSASTRVWILVLSPPRERPIAWSTPSFFGAGTVLMGARDGAVDHRVFVVRVGGQMLKNLFPDAGFRPAAEAAMNVLPVTEALREISPGNAGTVPVERCLHEQAVIRRGCSGGARPAWQHVFDPVPLVVSYSVTAHWPAPKS